MNTIVAELREFIDIAERDRKYAPNTATGYKVALSLFEKELNDEERGSLQTLKGHLEAIYGNVYRNNKAKYKSKSLEEYKKRVKKVVQDFEIYGNDPSKMSSWSPLRTRRGKSDKTKPAKQKDLESSNNLDETSREVVSLTRFELPLRPDVKAIILTPSDLTSEEADKIRAYIEYLKSVSKKENT